MFQNVLRTARLAQLHWELEESLRKIRWDCRAEAPGSERNAWRQALLRFSVSAAEPIALTEAG